jgi:alpha-D-xyloside xylohydrolase
MLAAAAKEKIEKSLVEIQNKFLAGQQRLRAEAMRSQQDLQDLEHRLLKTTREDLKKRIAKYAEKNGYDFVFDAAAMAYAKEAYDLTDAMLKDMGVETVVSVWPTIDEKSENFGHMADHGYLVRTDRGNDTMTWMGATFYFDATHPGAQKFVWERCKENYYKKGIRCFWLDEAEPEYGCYEFDNYRYFAGPALQTSNIYPVGYAKGFYDGLKEAGETEIMSLTRCAWAGSQKYAVLAWSGDIYSSFRAMREQLQAGLSMQMAGIPWWTSDIGGFMGGDISDPAFKELLLRWFAWGCFNPVFRMHGERSPWYEREQEFRNNIRQITSGQDNEVWAFGEDVYPMLTKYLFIRERIRPYVRQIMQEAHETGAPVMRPLSAARIISPLPALTPA